MNKRLLIVGILAAVLISAFSVISFTPAIPSQSNIPATHALYEGSLCVQKIDGLTGKVTDYGCTSPMDDPLTAYGQQVYQMETNGSAGLYFNMTNLTLGGNTSAMASSDTDLANIYTANGLGPCFATYTRIAAGNDSLNCVYTSSGASTYNVNATGIYNYSGGAGKMFAEAPFTNVPLIGTNGDKLNLTYYHWVV
jgi:hypothetical protein